MPIPNDDAPVSGDGRGWSFFLLVLAVFCLVMLVRDLAGCSQGSVTMDGMAQSTAERQRAFKQAMKDAGYVRLEAYVTREQREKFRQLGGDEWLRKKIDGAKPKESQ